MIRRSITTPAVSLTVNRWTVTHKQNMNHQDKFIHHTTLQFIPLRGWITRHMPFRILDLMNALDYFHWKDEWHSYLTAPLANRQVRTFCWLTRTRSFTRTARELHLTQSTVSHSMKVLDINAGRRILHRLGKKIVPSRTSEHGHSTNILEEVESGLVPRDYGSSERRNRVFMWTPTVH